MQLSKPSCRYCSELRESKDDINTARSLCFKCSKTRIALAKRAFLDRQVVVVAGGNYVVSKRMEAGYFRRKI